MKALDWSRCPEIESIPGKVSGAWVFRGTRIRRTECRPAPRRLKNGALLIVAEEAGFDLLITADQELAYQQNLPPDALPPLS
ncbi:MAG: hypothetical protein R2729_26900 [Bryobacteraceae bacterium]